MIRGGNCSLPIVPVHRIRSRAAWDQDAATSQSPKHQPRRPLRRLRVRSLELRPGKALSVVNDSQDRSVGSRDRVAGRKFSRPQREHFGPGGDDDVADSAWAPAAFRSGASERIAYRRDMVQLPRTSRPAGSFGVHTTVPATVCADLGISAAKRQAASANSNTAPVSRAVRNGCSTTP